MRLKIVLQSGEDSVLLFTRLWGLKKVNPTMVLHFAIVNPTMVLRSAVVVWKVAGGVL